MKYFSLLLIFLLTACANTQRTPTGFSMHEEDTNNFLFAVWEKNITAGKPLRIYIEGEGNPNPKKQTALIFAEKDPEQNVVYIARPCQFITHKACHNPAIWNESRFDPAIIAEMGELVTDIMLRYRAPYVELVGFEGGGTIALLLANRISFVKRVVTIASPLDTAKTPYPLDSSALNPSTEVLQLSPVLQIHFVGDKDKQATVKMAERFVSRLHSPKGAVVKKVIGVSEKDWDSVEFDKYF